MLYTLDRPLVPFSSHQPVLIHTINTIKEGNVLEYGVGWNSSPIMHLVCGLQGRNLLSVDTDKKWLGKFTSYQNGSHELLHLSEEDLCKWDHSLFKEKYAIAFIDGAPGEARQLFIEAIKDNVDYFVVHDTEEVLKKENPHPCFSYKWDFSGFKHQYHLSKGGPATSLLSNLDEIDKDLLTIF